MTDEAKAFLSFNYPEVKDLCKQFLTLVSGVLVLSITFSEKILNFQTARLAQRMCLLACWAMLITSLISCGFGLYLIFIAGESANGAIVYDYGRDFKHFAKLSYGLLDFSGISFVAALIMLIATSLPNVLGLVARAKEE